VNLYLLRAILIYVLLIICNFDIAPSKESKEAPPVSLLSIQAEQTKKETVAKAAPVTMSSKIQGASQVVSKQQQSGKSGQQQQAALTPWGSSSAAAAAATVSLNLTSNNGSAGKQHASGESNSASNSHTNTNGNSGGFWTDISDKKSSKHANNKS